jgi:hypothetical protein
MPESEVEGRRIEETLGEMASRCGDIERILPNWTRKPADPSNRLHVGASVASAVVHAFRVEASGLDGVTNGRATRTASCSMSRRRTHAAAVIRTEKTLLQKVVSEQFGNGERPGVEVRICSRGTPAQAQVCGRMSKQPPRKHIDVTDVPGEQPESNLPLVKRDRYWLTPIEVPFYDALVVVPAGGAAKRRP